MMNTQVLTLDGINYQNVDYITVVNNNKKYEQEVQSFLSMPGYSETNFNNFKNELLRQEALKKIQLKDYLPELWNLL